MDIKIIENGVSSEVFINLRRTTQFKTYGKEDVKEALKHTLYSVAIKDEDQYIGMARIVGDGRIAFFIKDVVVIPKYQHKHIGELIMKKLFEYIEKHACHDAYIGLMSTPNKEGFYKRFGFIERPTKDFGSGMVKFYEKR